MKLELVAQADAGNGSDPGFYTVDVRFQDTFIWAELPFLLFSWEPGIKVRIIKIQMVHISKHQNSVIIYKVETMVRILDVPRFLIKVPLLVGIVLYILLEVAMDSRIMFKMRVSDPGFVLASQHKIR